MWTTIGIIIVICSLFSVLFHDVDDAWYYTKKVLLFVPIILLAIFIHVIENFHKNRLGYIIMFLLIGFIVYGVVMGVKSGPSSPAPWE